MGYIGIMEKKMEITVLYWGRYEGLYREKGKEHGNYYYVWILGP